MELAERCRGVLGDSLRIDDISLRLRLSVGLALIEPGSSTAEVVLVKRRGCPSSWPGISFQRRSRLQHANAATGDSPN